MNSAIKPMMDMWLRLRDKVRDLGSDVRGIAATEFALVMPLFLAVTSARELDSGLPDRSGTMRVYDPETRLSWQISRRPRAKSIPAASGSMASARSSSRS